MKIAWTSKAANNFHDTSNYLLQTWGIKIAKKFIKDVDKTLDLIKRNRRIGKIEDEKDGVRGFLVFSQITPFYKLQFEEIIGLSFFDNRQNPNKKDC